MTPGSTSVVQVGSGCLPSGIRDVSTSVTSDGDESADLEVVLQRRPPIRLRAQQLVHVPVQVSCCHLRLTTLHRLHQGVVDEDVLFLERERVGGR